MNEANQQSSDLQPVDLSSGDTKDKPILYKVPIEEMELVEPGEAPEELEYQRTRSRRLTSEEVSFIQEQMEIKKTSLRKAFEEYVKNASLQGEDKEAIRTKLDESPIEVVALLQQEFPLEAGFSWGQCQNNTGRILAVYGPKPRDNFPYDNALYWLEDGWTSFDNWDCDGMFLPNDRRAISFNRSTAGQSWSGPAAIKISNGTFLRTRPNGTNGIDISDVVEVLRDGQVRWWIPNKPQSWVDAKMPWP